MSDETLKVFPLLVTPSQIMLYLLAKEDKGDRILRVKLFTREESKPLIDRDSEGLARINEEQVAKISQEIEFDKNIPKDESYFDRPVSTREELEAAGMTRESLREWKRFEDWFNSPHSSSIEP